MSDVQKQPLVTPAQARGRHAIQIGGVRVELARMPRLVTPAKAKKIAAAAQRYYGGKTAG